MSAELEHIWSRVQLELGRVVDEPTYRIWLEPLRAIDLTGNRLLVHVPPHAQRWIRARFGKILHASVQLVIGPDALLELAGADDDPAPAPRTAGRGRGRSATAALAAAASTASGQLGNPKLTFEQFVIGDCNRLAHAAALTVAEMPAAAYNPLFIYGPPGVGKTHLLSSIAALLLTHNPEFAVRATTGEAFTNEFLAALAAGQTDGFKARFRDVDVLLIDDVQFLERKTRTEEEFFHTFNALHDGGRQIVITSDRTPHDLQALEDRLRERFISGLVADMTAPDLSTRLAILRMRVHHDRIALADDGALAAIAERIHSNVRALEGALIRVIAFSSLSARPISRALAEEVLDSLYPHAPAPARARCSVADVQRAACRYFGVSPEELLSASRAARLTWPRQVAMYLARELCGESLPAIGRQFGGRDHTTVLHAWRKTASRLAADEAARAAVDTLRRALEGARG